MMAINAEKAAPPPEKAASFNETPPQPTVSNDRLQECISEMDFYESVNGWEPTATIALTDLIEGIRSEEFRPQIRKIRDLFAKGDDDGGSAEKSKLPAVSYSATIAGRRKQAAQEGRMTHTGLIQVDLDGDDNAGWTPEEMRAELMADEHVEAAFITPSGSGVKGLFRIAPIPTGKNIEEQHKAAFAQVAARFKRKNLVIDEACKDPVRLAFVSHDPDAWHRSGQTVPMQVDLTPPTQSKTSSLKLSASKPFPEPPQHGIHTWLMEAAWHCRAAGMTEAATVDKLQSYDGTLRRPLQATEADDAARAVFSAAKERAAHEEQARREKKPTAAFTVTHHGEVAGAAECLDFVEDTFTEGGASVIYGPSNTGKSFFMLDLAACVATGRMFRDELETEVGTVVYVALEGVTGMRNRIEAMHRENLLPRDAPLFLIFDAVNLLTEDHAEKLAEAVKAAAAQSNIPCKLVILDTMSRAMAGGDENKPADMTAAVAAIDAVRAATGAHVAVVHHSGKDEARGSRGHSSLRAAVDTEIEIIRAEGQSISTARVTKQRDLPFGPPMPYSLRVIEMGINRRGKPITSCVVQHEDEMMAATPAKAGRKKTYTADQLLEHLPAKTVGDWAKAVREDTGMSASLFYQFKAELNSRSAFYKHAGGISKT